MKMRLRFLWRLFQLKLSRAMVYRFAFFNAFFVDGAMFTLQLVMFNAIYAHADSIGGWGRAESLLFVGTFSLINALNMFLFFFGISSIADKIQTGGLDEYLTKPFPALLRLTFESVDLGSLPLVAMSVGIVAYAARQLPGPVGAANVIGYVVLVLLMLLLWYDMMLILRSVAFFTISITGIERFEGAVLEMCMKTPGTVFRGGFKLLFCVLLPYGIMGTAPVEWFTGTLTPLGLLGVLASACFFTGFAFWLFRHGVRHYKSASS